MLLAVFNELVEFLGIPGSDELPEGATEFDIAIIPPKKYFPFLEGHQLPTIEAVKECCAKFLELTIKHLKANVDCDIAKLTAVAVAPSDRGPAAFFKQAPNILSSSLGGNSSLGGSSSLGANTPLNSI